jgi:hypothetical protein
MVSEPRRATGRPSPFGKGDAIVRYLDLLPQRLQATGRLVDPSGPVKLGIGQPKKGV